MHEARYFMQKMRNKTVNSGIGFKLFFLLVTIDYTNFRYF